MQSSEATVVVIDDEPPARKSIIALLEVNRLKTIEFASAEQFLADLPHLPLNVCLITDITLHGMNGIELLQELKERKTAIPTIVITGHADIPLAVKAMRHGAVSFLEKPCKGDELLQTIDLAFQLQTQKQGEHKRNREILQRLQTLTKKERAVLDLLIEGDANKQIAMRLEIGLRTAEKRRADIFTKMKTDSLARLVQMTSSVGYQPNDLSL
ncbi:MAG: response regulator [Pirellulaceae bacterium]|nr:response regulator [Pirellulaceae bacterium]